MNAFQELALEHPLRVTLLIPSESARQQFINAIDGIESMEIKSNSKQRVQNDELAFTAEAQAWIREMESFDRF